MSTTEAQPTAQGFVPRNHSSLVIVDDWVEFVAWVKDAGYDESYLGINDSRCMDLQQSFLEEAAHEQGNMRP